MVLHTVAKKGSHMVKPLYIRQRSKFCEMTPSLKIAYRLSLMHLSLAWFAYFSIMCGLFSQLETT